MQKANHRLAKIFEGMAAIYRYKGKTERFRFLAYAKDARIIGGLNLSAWTYAKIWCGKREKPEYDLQLEQNVTQRTTFLI